MGIRRKRVGKAASSGLSGGLRESLYQQFDRAADLGAQRLSDLFCLSH